MHNKNRPHSFLIKSFTLVCSTRSVLTNTVIGSLLWIWSCVFRSVVLCRRGDEGEQKNKVDEKLHAIPLVSNHLALLWNCPLCRSSLCRWAEVEMRVAGEFRWVDVPQFEGFGLIYLGCTKKILSATSTTRGIEVERNNMLLPLMAFFLFSVDVWFMHISPKLKFPAWSRVCGLTCTL